jgi:hypothetical protein
MKQPHGPERTGNGLQCAVHPPSLAPLALPAKPRLWQHMEWRGASNPSRSFRFEGVPMIGGLCCVRVHVPWQYHSLVA